MYNAYNLQHSESNNYLELNQKVESQISTGKVNLHFNCYKITMTVYIYTVIKISYKEP